MRNTHHCIINRTYNPFWVGNPKKQVLLYIFCCCHICLFNEQNIICYIAVICSSLAHHIKEQFCWPKEKRSNHISNLTLMTAIYQVEHFPWVGFKPPHGNKVILTKDMAYILIRSVSIGERIYIFHNSYILNCYKWKTPITVLFSTIVS